MDELQKLMDEISQWSNATFGEGKRNPAIIHHLKKEVDELIVEINKTNAYGCDNSIGIGEFGRQMNKTLMEYADCFMLLFDSASHFNLNASDIFEITRLKLEINKKRNWGKPDENGVVEHIG